MVWGDCRTLPVGVSTRKVLTVAGDAGSVGVLRLHPAQEARRIPLRMTIYLHPTKSKDDAFWGLVGEGGRASLDTPPFG